MTESAERHARAQKLGGSMLQDSAIEFNDMPNVQASSPSEEHRNHKIRRHMHDRRVRKATRKELISRESYCPPRGVNLRDVGAVTCGPMREGALFRSSELLSKEEMRKHQIKTILDLRRMDRPCKKEPGGNKVAESTKVVIKYLLLGPSRLIPEKRLLFVHRAHPSPCPLCYTRAKRRYDQEINVIHADLIPSTVGLRIFQAMPARVQMKAIVGALIGKGAASVMAPAVANPLLLGYKALYKTLLEDSKRGMALALRPFVDLENYPILVHCIHGKDRTGLIIMLLLLLCDVQPEAIVDDYMLSETVLKESRMHDELHFDVYLTSDDVIAATRDTMEETIQFINSKYGGVRHYLNEIGLEDWEIHQIRENLSRPENQEPPPAPKLHPRFSIHSIFPKRRGSDGAPNLEVGRASTLPPIISGQQLSDKKSCSFGSSPVTYQNTDSTPEEVPFDRRASVANSGPAEIREMMSRVREQHPELGPLTDERSVDLLRHSPNPLVRLAPLLELDSFTAGKASGPERSLAAPNGVNNDRNSAEVDVCKAAGKGIPTAEELLAEHRTLALTTATDPTTPTSPFAAV